MIRVLAASFAFVFSVSALAAERRSLVPEHQVIKTKNGATVYYFPSPKIPLFQLELVFEGGSVLDPEGRSGLALLSSGMARKGIPGFDENALSSKLDDLAAGIQVAAEDEDVSFSAYGLNEQAPQIIDLFFRQISEPTFPQGPFARVKANHLDSIQQLPDSAGALAGHVLNVLLFNGTEYARPGSGLYKDVARITLDEARAYYPSLVRPDHLKALVIGGKSKGDVLDRVVKGIEALPCSLCGTPQAEPRSSTIAKWRVPRGHAVVIDRPGISEAHVRMGFLGPKRKIPEFYDLTVTEAVLGGHFSSRLNSIIREKLNLTYGIGASYKFGWKMGSFVVSTSTRTEKTGELLVATQKLLRDFAKEGPTEAELTMAKDYLTGSFPLALQNLYAIAATFFSGRINELEPEFLDAYQDRIRGVTTTSLKAALAQHFKLDEMTTVIVGDSKAITRELKKANIKYVVRDARDFL